MNIDEIKKEVLNEYYLNELIKECINKDVIPFVGAGLSYPTYPLWSDYITSIACDFNIELDKVKVMLNKGLYEDASEYIYDIIGERAFRDHIKVNFNRNKLNTSKQNRALKYLPNLFPNIVITTNYDCSLEYVYEQEKMKFDDCLFPSQSEKIVESIFSQNRYLIKIHGDVESRSDIILSKKQYDELYGTDTDIGKPFTKLLGRIMLSKRLFFLGCSINNDRTIKTLQLISKILGQNIHYAIIEKPKENEDFLKRLKFISDLGIRPIWYPYNKHEYVSYILEYICKSCENYYKNNGIKNTSGNELPNGSNEFLTNSATVDFDNLNGMYKLKFVKQFKLLINGCEWFDAHFHSNKILNNIQESVKYYKDNPVRWESLNVYASIKVKRNLNDNFGEEKQVIVYPLLEKNNYIQFRILYRTIDGERLNISKGDIIELKYEYEISNKLWGNYLTRNISYFGENAEINLIYSGHMKYDLYAILDSDTSPILIDKENYTSVKKVQAGKTIETIFLPQARCGRFRLFWNDSSNYEQ